MSRWGLAPVLGAALMFAGRLAAADDFPNRPIRFVQGFAAGGNADAIVRTLGDYMSKSLGWRSRGMKIHPHPSCQAVRP